MSDLLEKKTELLRQVVEATKRGHTWERVMPDVYTAPWQDRRLIHTCLPDEPLTLIIALPEPNVIDGILSGGDLVTISLLDGFDVVSLMWDLELLIHEAAREIDSASNERATVQRQVAIVRLAQTEASELDRLLATA